jgi:hypothetical protein
MPAEDKALSLKVVNHRGKEILYLDYRNLQGQPYIDALKRNRDHIVASGKRGILLLVDVRGSVTSSDATSVIKQTAKDYDPQVTRTAILGIAGLKKIILQAVATIIKTRIKAFDSEDEAKEWLSSD